MSHNICLNSKIFVFVNTMAIFSQKNTTQPCTKLTLNTVLYESPTKQHLQCKKNTISKKCLKQATLVVIQSQSAIFPEKQKKLKNMNRAVSFNFLKREKPSFCVVFFQSAFKGTLMHERLPRASRIQRAEMKYLRISWKLLFYREATHRKASRWVESIAQGDCTHML